MLNLIVPSSYSKEIEQSRLGLAFRNAQSLKDRQRCFCNPAINRQPPDQTIQCEWESCVDAPNDVLSFENAYSDPETGAISWRYPDLIRKSPKQAKESLTSGAGRT